MDCFQSFKIKIRLAFELVRAVAGSDCDCKGVNTGLLYELRCFVRVCEGCRTRVNFNIVLNARKLAEFRFNYNAACAYSTTSFVRRMFSSNGYLEPSIITEVKPSSTHFLQMSKSSPWSR